MTAVAIIGICQVLGYALVLGIQKYLIDGLRNSLKDQKESIDALKTQAEGQASLTKQQEAYTEQLRKSITDLSAVYDKRLTLEKDNAEIEKKTIEQQLTHANKQLEESSKAQINKVEALGIPAEITAALTQIIGEDTSTKKEILALSARLESLTNITQHGLSYKSLTLGAIFPRVSGYFSGDILTVSSRINHNINMIIGLHGSQSLDEEITKIESTRFNIITNFPEIISYYGPALLDEAIMHAINNYFRNKA
ncbi:MAG: hypothetical protein ACRYFK_14275 [Janthinobacterium lividum]